MKAPDAAQLIALWFQLQGIDVDRIGADQSRFVDRCLEELQADRPVALPCRTDDFAGYYCVASGFSELRAFREEVASFVGRAYGLLEPENRSLEAASELEALLREYGLTHVFRVRRTDFASTDALRRAFDLLYETRRLRPPRVNRATRPLRHVLRDFAWSLDNGDPMASMELLAEARALGILSEDNLRFLEVRRAAALSEWTSLWESGLIEYLLDVPCPADVADALLAAIWCRHLAEVADGDMIARFREDVEQQYGPAFSRAAVAHSPDAMRMAMVFAASRTPARVDLAHEMLDRARHDSEFYEELQRLWSLADGLPSEQADPAAAARRALEDREFDRCLELLRDAEPTVERAVMLVEVAFHLPGSANALVAYKALVALSVADRASLPSTPGFTRMLDWIEAVAAPLANEHAVGRVPESWDEWLDVVERDPDWPYALDVARDGADQWDVNPLLADAALASRLATRLVSCNDRVRHVVVAALPHLERFLRRSVTDSRLIPLTTAELQVLILDDAASALDLQVAVEILDRLVPLGLERAAYQQLVDDVRSVWDGRLASFEHLDWALSIVDVLARSPCPHEEARLLFLAQTSNVMLRARHRLGPSDITYALLLFGECGQQVLLDALTQRDGDESDREAATVSPWAQLADLVVGLHCLFEPIVRRFPVVVRQLAPVDRVEIDQSKDCSPKLKDFCRSVDLLVLVTQHAKHAAVECIERHAVPPVRVVRSQQSRIGLSGVLRALEQHLSTGAEAA